MPFDSNGNFSLVPGTIVSDGMTIQPSQHNPPFQDVAAGLSMAVVRDGRAPMTGPLNMNGFVVGGMADGVSQSDAATVGQSAPQIGDFKDTVRSLDSNWLRRNGAAYPKASYPELAVLLPDAPVGIAWTSRTIPTVTKKSAPVWDGVKWVFIGASESIGTCIIGSVDGDNWEVISQIFSGVGGGVFSLAYGNGLYVTSDLSASNKTHYSSDGEDWSDSSNTLGPQIVSVAFDPTINRFYSVSNTQSSGAYPIRQTSTGTAWDAASSVSGFEGGARIQCKGGKIFIGTVADAALSVSSDGASTWQSVITPGQVGGIFGNQFIEFTNGQFFLSTSSVGAGAVYRSSDLSLWSNLKSLSFSSQAIVARQDVIACAGTNGNFSVSMNGGTVWSESSYLSSSSASAVIITSTDGEFIVFPSATPTSIVRFGVLGQAGFFLVPNDNATYGWIKAL